MGKAESLRDTTALRDTTKCLSSLLNEIETLSAGSLTPAEYFEQLLPQVMQLFAAWGGCIWSRDDLAHPIVAEGIGGDHSWRVQQQMQLDRCELVSLAFEQGRLIFTPAQAAHNPKQKWPQHEPTEILWLFAPISLQGQAKFIIEIRQRVGASSQIQTGYAKLLKRVCGFAETWLSRVVFEPLPEPKQVAQEATLSEISVTDTKPIQVESDNAVPKDLVHISPELKPQEPIISIKADESASAWELPAPVFDESNPDPPTIAESIATPNQENTYSSDSFALRVHASLDRHATAAVIANEMRRGVGCDRASLLIMQGQRCWVEAVSGQERFDSRSNVISRLARLAKLAARGGEPLVYDGSTADMAPELEAAINDFVEASFTKTIVILPILLPNSNEDQDSNRQDSFTPQILGAVVLEQIKDDLPATRILERSLPLMEHSRQALANVQTHHSLFLMPLWKKLGSTKAVVARRNLPLSATIGAVLLFVLAALVVVPTNFRVHAEGRLQPVERQDIYADLEGVVDEVRVRHGSQVKAGDVLVVLRNEDLQGKLRTVLGDMDVARVRRESLRKDRSQARNLTSEERNRLTRDLSELDERLTSLEAQRAILQQQVDRLVVRSPVAGSVITWDVETLLRYRPLARGQVLMTIALVEGPWELELLLPEKRVGHLLTAQASAVNNPLKVQYVVATHPDLRQEGTLRDTHISTQENQAQGRGVKLFVTIDKQTLPELRSGASVSAKIYCGTSSLGYAWFHDVWEFIETRVFF